MERSAIKVWDRKQITTPDKMIYLIWIYLYYCFTWTVQLKNIMVLYRRNLLPGGTYFFTVTLLNRRSCLLIEHVDLLKESFSSVKKEHPFSLLAYVVLPDHLHMIWKLPPDDYDYSVRWKKIKAEFSKSMKRAGFQLAKTKHQEIRLWQRRFWEHTIRDSRDLENHINYIHYNPIKHGLVKRLSDWPHSSFHQFVIANKLPINWAENSASPETVNLYKD